MKESIGMTWVFTLVITLLVVFSGFIALSTNYARTFNIKDEIVSIITKEGGVDTNTITKINDHLKKIGYGGKGRCPGTGCWYGFNTGFNDRTVGYSRDINYCIKKSETANINAIGHPERKYYSVAVFFRVDLPLIRNVFYLTIEGETPVIVRPGNKDRMINESSCIS